MADIAIRIASAILVDPDGRVLLQLRDGNTDRDPHRWGVPGGRLEAGETPYQAAVRELEEETGLRVPELELFFSGPAPLAQPAGAFGEFNVFYAPTSATQGDVACYEGEAMRFVSAEDVPGLECGAAYSEILPRFLSSLQYHQLRDRRQTSVE